MLSRLLCSWLACIGLVVSQDAELLADGGGFQMYIANLVKNGKLSYATISGPEEFVKSCLGESTQFGAAKYDLMVSKRYKNRCATRDKLEATVGAALCAAVATVGDASVFSAVAGGAASMACAAVESLAFGYQQAYAWAWLQGHPLDKSATDIAAMQIVGGADPEDVKMFLDKAYVGRLSLQNVSGSLGPSAVAPLIAGARTATSKTWMPTLTKLRRAVRFYEAKLQKKIAERAETLKQLISDVTDIIKNIRSLAGTGSIEAIDSEKLISELERLISEGKRLIRASKDIVKLSRLCRRLSKIGDWLDTAVVKMEAYAVKAVEALKAFGISCLERMADYAESFSHYELSFVCAELDELVLHDPTLLKFLGITAIYSVGYMSSKAAVMLAGLFEKLSLKTMMIEFADVIPVAGVLVGAALEYNDQVGIYDAAENVFEGVMYPRALQLPPPHAVPVTHTVLVHVVAIIVVVMACVALFVVVACILACSLEEDEPDKRYFEVVD